MFFGIYDDFTVSFQTLILLPTRVEMKEFRDDITTSSPTYSSTHVPSTSTHFSTENPIHTSTYSPFHSTTNSPTSSTTQYPSTSTHFSTENPILTSTYFPFYSTTFAPRTTPRPRPNPNPNFEELHTWHYRVVSLWGSEHQLVTPWDWVKYVSVVN